MGGRVRELEARFELLESRLKALEKAAQHFAICLGHGLGPSGAALRQQSSSQSGPFTVGQEQDTCASHRCHDLQNRFSQLEDRLSRHERICQPAATAPGLQVTEGAHSAPVLLQVPSCFSGGMKVMAGCTGCVFRLHNKTAQRGTQGTRGGASCAQIPKSCHSVLGHCSFNWRVGALHICPRAKILLRARLGIQTAVPVCCICPASVQEHCHGEYSGAK